MDDITQVEMAHLSGEEPKTFARTFEAGERIISQGHPVRQLFILKRGTVMLTPAPGVKVDLAQTEYVGMRDGWSVLGARPFFAGIESLFNYTALEDCEVFSFDSRMFQTEREGKGLSRGSLLGIARGLVLNSDISEIFVPKIARAMGYSVTKPMNLRTLQACIRTISKPKNAKRFQKLAFEMLVKLLRKHELVMKGNASIVGSAALASDLRRHIPTPPPAPGSLARGAWLASKAS